MRCPTDDQLAAHLDGALPDGEAAAIGDHVDVCASCRSAAIALVRARGTPVGPGESPPVPAASLEAGATLGRYRIVATLGAGAMGVVYRAHDPALERDVALKVLRLERHASAAALSERLVRESRLLARVADPAVVTIHDVGVDDGRVYLAMELIEGATLRAWLAAAPRSTTAILAVLTRAAAGLQAAHRAGIVHRDFKPDNVLVAPLDAERPTRVAVSDLGVARVVDEPGDAAAPPTGAAVGLTSSGIAIGTPAYMAPEQLDGAAVDARADVFAFAVTAWEALYVERPFPGQTIAALRVALEAPPPTPPAVGRGGPVPAAVRAALRAALAPEAAARPSSMDAMIAALSPPPRPRRARVAIGLGVVAVAAAATGLAIGRAFDRGPSGPCATARAAVRASWPDLAGPRLGAHLLGLGAAPPVVERAVAGTQRHAGRIRAVLDERCAAGVAPAPVHACLAARQTELAAVARQLARFAADQIATGVPMLARSMNDPDICLEPATGTVAAAWPAEPERQDAVASVRLRVAGIEAARDRSEFAEALTAAQALAPEIAAIGWEPLSAEHLYLIGTIQSLGTDPVVGDDTLREAAALAERVHHDYIAASVWLLLIQGAAFTERNAVRALEYARYADAASARLRRPPGIEIQLAYARGTALIENGELSAGEAELRRGLELAEAVGSDQVGLLVQGLAYAFENQGHFAEAAATYRRALELGARDGNLSAPSEVIYRMRLATNLGNLGDADGALVEAEAATKLADAILPPAHLDRAITYGNRAEVLRAIGRPKEALEAISVARTRAAALIGERSELYGTLLAIEGGIQAELGHHKVGADLIRRACEISAFANGDADVRTHACRADGAAVLVEAGDPATAKRWVEAALPALREALGEDHAQVATTMQALGAARAALRDAAGAIVAYEDALARMQRSGIGPGFVASTQWSLGQALPRRELTRARALVTAAVEVWRAAPTGWQQQLDDAEAWLRAHP